MGSGRGGRDIICSSSSFGREMKQSMVFPLLKDVVQRAMGTWSPFFAIFMTLVARFAIFCKIIWRKIILSCRYW